jgi:hypothetical protein
MYNGMWYCVVWWKVIDVWEELSASELVCMPLRWRQELTFQRTAKCSPSHLTERFALYIRKNTKRIIFPENEEAVDILRI